MDWILLDNKPLKKITEQHSNINDKLDSILQKMDDLEKQNKNLEQFLIHNQKLYLKQFNIICDILQENRSLYMKEFQHESDEIESLKPILHDIKEKKANLHNATDIDNSDDETIMARLNNIIWRSRSKSPNNISHLTTTPDNKIVTMVAKQL
jgi:hypothetical protein